MFVIELTYTAALAEIDEHMGVVLGLDADEPQIFVTVSDDLVQRGLSAGDLVRDAVGAIDGRGGGRPEMAQGKGSRREGLPDGLAAIASAVRARAEPGA